MSSLKIPFDRAQIVKHFRILHSSHAFFLSSFFFLLVFSLPVYLSHIIWNYATCLTWMLDWASKNRLNNLIVWYIIKKLVLSSIFFEQTGCTFFTSIINNKISIVKMDIYKYQYVYIAHAYVVSTYTFIHFVLMRNAVLC